MKRPPARTNLHPSLQHTGDITGHLQTFCCNIHPKPVLQKSVLNTRDDIVYECNKDILYDNVNDVDVTIAEAVVWLIHIIVADLDTTGAS